MERKLFECTECGEKFSTEDYRRKLCYDEDQDKIFIRFMAYCPKCNTLITRDDLEGDK